ncbi:hypothetical protein [Geminocystis herdmanii]|uniref:hypothetical protein n=1 Tax=Geminocystis herdmanii TaxID=669359 RepID=UPI00034B782D|nr:hypothetical protein [Geminocystis herdmanii]
MKTLIRLKIEKCIEDKKDSSKKGVLSKIKQIKIQALTDFSVNIGNGLSKNYKQDATEINEYLLNSNNVEVVSLTSELLKDILNEN